MNELGFENEWYANANTRETSKSGHVLDSLDNTTCKLYLP